MIPSADLVGNLTPDKQHSAVIGDVMGKMKKGAALWYSHGFNIVEEGMKIRDDITVVMCAPKGPGTEVWHEFQRGFGVPDLIAVHPANDPEHKGWDIAKALAGWAVQKQAFLNQVLLQKLNPTLWVNRLFFAECFKPERLSALIKW